MKLDPALATVIVATIGLAASWIATRATRSGKAKEVALQQAAQVRADRDASFEHMERSRDAAIEDAKRERENATRYRIERDASDAHNALLIQELTNRGIPVPNRPRT